MKNIFASALIVTILLSACTQKPSVPREPSADEGKAAESNQQIKIVKYDGTVQNVNANYEELPNYYTELSAQLYNFYHNKTACRRIKSSNFGTSSKTYIDDEKNFRAELEGYIDEANMDPFISEAKKMLEVKNALVVSHICKTETEIYITFWTGKYLYIALWNGKEFTMRETIGLGKSDYMDVFIPNYFGKKHLLGTSGDGYLARWNLAEFDFATRDINYIENCSAISKEENEQGRSKEISIQCDMEYSSEKGVVKYTESQFKKCSNETASIRKNDCLSALANYDFTKTVKAEIDPQEICNLISDDEQKNICFWGYAMNLKDATLCDQITINQETKSPPISIKNCKEELNYENQGAIWKLDSGIPYITNHRLYMGYGKFSGWIVIEERDKSNFDKILFHVTEKDLNKLPPSLQKLGDGEITNLSSSFIAITSLDQLPEYLRKSSANNPATIEVQGIAIYDDQLDFWLDYEIEPI